MSRDGARGFTLLELSIVLALIGVITGTGLMMMTAGLQASQYNATVKRMDEIEQALYNYVLANTRLPCPGDLTVKPDGTTYGLEAGASAGGAGTGECVTGMTPAANFKAASGTEEGGVPTRALQLPDDYMYDGWGRRFRYAVDPTFTLSGNFPTLTGGCATTTSAITVKDAAAGSRSTAAAYVLMSHGANGHGAYTSNGSIYNARITNTDELANCHCTNAGAYSGSYTPTYVEKIPTQDSSNALNGFDDIITFKEPWQIQGPNFQLVSTNCVQYLALTGNADTVPYVYAVKNGNFTLLPAPSTIGCWNWNDGRGDFTPDGTLAFSWSMWQNSGSCTKAGMLYKPTPSSINYLSNNVNASEAPGPVAFSPDGNSMALSTCVLNGTYDGCTSSPLRLYSKASGYSTIVGTATPAPTDHYAVLAWSPDGNYLYGMLSLAVNTDIYTHSGNSLTYLTTLSTGWTSDIAVHPSGTYLAWGAGDITGYVPNVIKNPWLGAGATSLGGSASGLTNQGSNHAVSVAWSPDGNYLAVAMYNASAPLVYRFNAANAPVYFTPMTVTGSSCASSNWAGTRFSSDSTYLSFLDTSNLKLCVFKRSGTTWTQTYSTSTPSGPAAAVWSK